MIVLHKHDIFIGDNGKKIPTYLLYLFLKLTICITKSLSQLSTVTSSLYKVNVDAGQKNEYF